MVSRLAGISGWWCRRRTATATNSQRRSHSRGQLITLLTEQPDHLGADDARPEDGHPDSLHLRPRLEVSRNSMTA